MLSYKKRISAGILFALLTLTFLLTGCSKGEKTVLNMGGANIKTGIFTYFADKVVNSPDNADKDEDTLRQLIYDELKTYIAVNTLAGRNGVSLSYDDKVSCAEDTEDKWNLFGEYYSSIGVNKTDINKISENYYLKLSLLQYYYGENSKVKPTSVEELKAAFAKKYVGVNVIAASLTKTDNLGNVTSLDDESLKTIREKFSSMKTRLNYGADFASVYEEYILEQNLISSSQPEVFLFTRDSIEYGENFFNTIYALQYNRADVIEFEDNIYLVYRLNITGDNYTYFGDLSSEILYGLKSASFNKRVNKEASKYTVEKEKNHLINKIINDLEDKK